MLIVFDDVFSYNFTEFDEQVSIAVGDECADALRKTTAAFEDGVKKGQGKTKKHDVR